MNTAFQEWKFGVTEGSEQIDRAEHDLLKEKIAFGAAALAEQAHHVKLTSRARSDVTRPIVTARKPNAAPVEELKYLTEVELYLSPEEQEELHWLTQGDPEKLGTIPPVETEEPPMTPPPRPPQPKAPPPSAHDPSKLGFVCPFCGHRNKAGRNDCVACGAPREVGRVEVQIPPNPAMRDLTFGWHVALENKRIVVKGVDRGLLAQDYGVVAGAVLTSYSPSRPEDAGGSTPYPWPVDPDGDWQVDTMVLDHEVDEIPAPVEIKAEKSPGRSVRCTVSTRAGVTGVEEAYIDSRIRPMSRFENQQKFSKRFVPSKVVPGKTSERGAALCNANFQERQTESHGFCRSVYMGFQPQVANNLAVQWVNDYFKIRILSVRELMTAVPYLYMLDVLCTGKVRLTSVHLLDSKRERAANWEYLRLVWTELGVGKELVVAVDLVSLEKDSRPEPHVLFLERLYALFESRMRLRGSMRKDLPVYDPMERRRGRKCASWIKRVPQLGVEKDPLWLKTSQCKRDHRVKRPSEYEFEGTNLTMAYLMGDDFRHR